MKYIKMKSTGSTYIDSQDKDLSHCNECDIKLGNISKFKYIPFIRFGKLNINSSKRIKKIVLVLKVNDVNLDDLNLSDLFLCTIIEDFNPCKINWNTTPKNDLEQKSTYKVKYYNNSILINITDVYKTTLYTNKNIFGFSVFSNSLNRIISINNTTESPYITVEYKEDKPIPTTSISKIINEFDEKYLSINSRDEVLYTDPIKISHFRNATFFIKNNGLNNVYVSVEISPDGINFVRDLDEKNVNHQSSSVFVIARFLKYTRLKIINLNTNTESDLMIWFQGQKYNYKLIKEVNI